MIMFSHVVSMDSQLGEFERRHAITKRWKPTDVEFGEARHAYFIEKQQLLYSSLRTAMVKRQYLLKLKAKYAGIWHQL